MLQRTDPARRRPAPLLAAALLAATATALPVARWGDSALVLILVPAAVAGFVVGRHLRSLAPAAAAIVAVLVVSLPAAYVLPGGSPLGDWMASVLIALLTVVAPWWLGRYRLLKAEQRESDAAILSQRAQAEERARIADDLHDTIGHELALIAVQAGALELGREMSSEHRAQFRELREAAVRASGRLRDVVQMTRPEEPGRLDPHGGDGIDAIIAGARDAGMTVDALLDATVVSQAHPLLAELAARVVREGLTNAARHAPGAAVEVRLGVARRDAAAFEVTVRSGAGEGDSGSSQGGHGIPSLQRRAELLGGEVDANATEDGGFQLRLRAPMRPRPVQEAPRGADPALLSNARTARRRVWQATGVPAAITVLILAGFLVVQAITVTQTAISSQDYERIQLGTTRADLADVLPAGMPRPVPVVAEPPVPERWECEYFAARDGWLHFTDATYRLCFDEGALVEKRLLGAS